MQDYFTTTGKIVIFLLVSLILLIIFNFSEQNLSFL